MGDGGDEDGGGDGNGDVLSLMPHTHWTSLTHQAEEGSGERTEHLPEDAVGTTGG